MIRVLFVILLMINVAYAGGERYFIKLGSFKNLQGLEKSIAKMPKSLRSHVSIVLSKGWYIPFAYYKKSKKGLSSKVKAYKRYFADAHVTHGRRMFGNKVVYKFGKKIRHSSSRKKTVAKKRQYSTHLKKRVSIPKRVTLQNVAISSDDNTLNIPIKNYSSQNIPSILEALPLSSSIAPSAKIEQKSYKFFTKQMLSGNHYYMTYKDPRGGTSLLIKVSFGADSVIYQPVLGDMQMTQANYLVENHRLYMFAENFSPDGAYSTLDEHRRDHFLVSSWMDKKKLNTLRYYYKLNDAKKYLGEETSAGLSEVLQEGNFDEFFLSEEDY
jgi:hypothetical protein